MMPKCICAELKAPSGISFFVRPDACEPSAKKIKMVSVVAWEATMRSTMSLGKGSVTSSWIARFLHSFCNAF